MKSLSALLVLLAGTGTALAQDAVPETSRGPGPFAPGWYAAPMVSWVMPDSQRCGVDNGLGGMLVFGHRGDFASLEVAAHYQALPFDCTYSAPDPADETMRITVNEQGDLKLTGGGLGLLVGPFSADGFLSRLFGVVGFGVNQRNNHPQYDKDVSTIYGDAGVGYMQPFELFGWSLNARAEVRYRYDAQQPPQPENLDPPPPEAYSDLVFNLGLQIPFTQAAAEAAPVAAAPVAVVPAAYADADNDGVIDERDQCPDTPANSYVDNVGCPGNQPPALPPPAPAAEPAVLETAKAGDTFVLKGVTFETGKSKLRADSKTILDDVAEALLKRQELRIEVGGHTDDRGSDANNQALSQRRADSVRDYLVGRGVHAERLTAVGYGESQPVDTNESDEGRERNRRVELRVLE